MANFHAPKWQFWKSARISETAAPRMQISSILTPCGRKRVYVDGQVGSEAERQGPWASCCFIASCLDSQITLRQVHQMTPKWPYTKRWNVPIYLLQVPQHPKFQSTSLCCLYCTAKCFWVYNLQEDIATIPQVPFTPFYSTASHFHVTSHFGTTAPNDPKWP